MAIKIIRHREIIETVHYNLFFERRGESGSGWVPECDEHGNVDEESMNPTVRSIWEDIKLRRNKIDADQDEEFRPPYVMKYTSHYTEPAVGRCHCGSEVSLGDFTNTCENCGTDYNSGGQELAPRDQWGEETGEHWSECVGPFDGSELE